jgi:dipeptidyl aminopeptidase/acylaminoacyl peptidase
MIFCTLGNFTNYPESPMSLPLAKFAPLVAAILLATCAVAASARAAEPLPSIDSFFASPRFGTPQLSPNGKLLAVVTGAPGKRDELTVLDLADNRVYVAANFSNADIGAFQWVNDKRLVFTSRDKQTAPGEQRSAPGLFAANFDGSGQLQLAERWNNVGYTPTRVAKGRVMLPWHTFLAPQPGPQNSDSVYVYSSRVAGAEFQEVDLLLLDTVSGRFKKVDGPANTHAWMLDQNGEPRLAATGENDTQSIHYRDPASGAWRQLLSSKILVDRPWAPLAFGPDGTLYVAAGKDKSAVHTVDVASGKLSEQPLVNAEDYDFNGRLIMGKNGLLGFRIVAEAESTMWFDPKMKALQADIDQQLAGTINMLSVPKRGDTPWVVVESYSDVRPRMLMIYNSATKSFKRIGSTNPAIKPEQMGPQEAVSYKARDGLTIPALLTLPPGGKRAGLPLVVLVHGGPYTRGNSWGWNPQSQFLASRGYAVLEPAFRGSTGFGQAHFKAGWKQWGLKMQDDIADGAKWTIAQGLVDAKRICIAGASYGGYATLMGLVNDPALFKCGVNWVGVTDIALLSNGQWNFQDDMTERLRKYSFPLLVGDLVKDAAQLKATSPIEQAARITQPLLLAYGGADRRVPKYHGSKFYDAVKKTNPDVEWVLYEDEGHGWAMPETRVDFWGRVEKFLGKQIGQP